MLRISVISRKDEQCGAALFQAAGLVCLQGKQKANAFALAFLM